jgi:hypothetical protein
MVRGSADYWASLHDWMDAMTRQTHVREYTRGNPYHLAYVWKTVQLRREIDARIDHALSEAGFYEAIEELMTDEFLVHGGLT